MVLIPLTSTSTCLWALLLPGDTTDNNAYVRLNSILGGEFGLKIATLIVLICCVAAWRTRRARVRLVSLYVVMVGWSMFLLAIFFGRPQAMLPGAALAVVMCAACALHEQAGRQDGTL